MEPVKKEGDLIRSPSFFTDLDDITVKTTGVEETWGWFEPLLSEIRF
jgi:hypothetical protein